MTNFMEFLKSNPYPGRGIAVGKNCVYYFIMGRSENSRNRIFVKTEDGIRTEAFDPSKMRDPSLIIYHPVRQTEQGLSDLSQAGELGLYTAYNLIKKYSKQTTK